MTELFFITLGVVLGILLCLLIAVRLRAGTILIDRSDPNVDKYRFEVDNLDDLHKKQYILLRVDTGVIFSQE